MHRDFDVVPLERFVFRLSALSQEEWARLAADAAALRGESVEALWRRAELEALSDPAIARWARLPAQVAGVVAAMMDELQPGIVDTAPRISVHAVREPGGRRYLELLADTYDLVEANAPGDEGVAAAVLGAAMALAAGPRDEARLRRAYRFVEGVIPLASVQEPPSIMYDPGGARSHNLRITSHLGFRRHPPTGAVFVRWTLPWPSPVVVRPLPSSLYTFPRRGLGSGLGRPEGRPFPEFESIHARHFGRGVPC